LKPRLRISPPGKSRTKQLFGLVKCVFLFQATVLVPDLGFAADTNTINSTNTLSLPPPANVKIDFVRDIKPILDESCIRCHGPEKPKSRFRLDDRDAALKGGREGVDIIPGNSAESPLIRYVTGQDPDIMMPPSGKGQPLTSNQIALLRAWIDQGVAWEAANTSTSTAFFAPFGEFTAVSGDTHKFRELNWQQGGLNGGLDEFDLWEQTAPNSTLSLSGRLALDDYNILLQKETTDLGFFHAGWNQYRKYFDDTGGYNPLVAPTAPSLGRDLYLDVGRGWADLGLNLPGWPQMVVGYEYQYKQGNESSLSWASASPVGPAAIYPASDYIQEHTHILKFDLDGEFAGTRVEDSFRGEFYSLQHSQTNFFYSQISLSPNTSLSAESYHYFEGANTIRLERKFTDWLFGSAGYLYSSMDATASANGNTTDTSALELDNSWQSQGITLNRQSNVGNINALFGPWSGLTFSTGVQAELTREDAVGNVDLLTTLGGAPLNTPAVTPLQMITSQNTSLVEESATAHYTKIPFTSLFAEVRLRQERIGESWDQPNDGSFVYDPSLSFNEVFTSYMYDWQVGFNTSPLSWASLSAHYRQYDDDSHYDVINDIEGGVPNLGYPGFLNARDLLTDEVEARLALRPVNWLKTSFAYKLMDTDYRTTTYPAIFPPPVNTIISPGGTIPAGESDVQVYSLNAIFTPWQRLSLSGTFSFQRSSTVTADNGSTAVEPYRGDTYSALASAIWAVNRASDLLLTYTFSKADFSQDNFAAGLPLGIQYQQHALRATLTRRLSKSLVAKFQYGFFYYDEPSSGGADNYRANSILGMLTYRLP
jgi:hypothetical protein